MESAETNVPESHGVKLQSLLKLRNDSKNILQNRENSQLEFKETFNLGSLAKYSRTMAAFANNKGGYIVFGVEPSPHRLKGVNKGKFEECDRRGATFLRAYICSRTPRICSSSFSARIGLSLPELAPIEKHWQASSEIRMASPAVEDSNC